MGTTVPSGLRFPEDGDPPDGPLAFKNLADDVERALTGRIALPTPAAGFGWLETHGGLGIAHREGDLVRVTGTLKRTGAPLVMTIGQFYVALRLPWAGHSIIGQDGLTFTTNGPVRYYITEGSSDLGLIAYQATTIATNSQISVCLMYMTGNRVTATA